MSNFYISKACMMNLLIFYHLLEHGYVTASDFDIPIHRFKRYIANIRVMLSDNFLYHLNVVYDYATNRYVLER